MKKRARSTVQGTVGSQETAEDEDNPTELTPNTRRIRNGARQGQSRQDNLLSPIPENHSGRDRRRAKAVADAEADDDSVHSDGIPDLTTALAQAQESTEVRTSMRDATSFSGDDSGSVIDLAQSVTGTHSPGSVTGQPPRRSARHSRAPSNASQSRQ